MKVKKIIGYCLVASPLVAVLISCAFAHGVLEALAVLGILASIVVLVAIGKAFIDGDL